MTTNKSFPCSSSCWQRMAIACLRLQMARRRSRFSLQAPQIDLVLADTNMPQMSGIQLARAAEADAVACAHDPARRCARPQAARSMLADAGGGKNCSSHGTAGAREVDERAQARPAQGRAALDPGMDDRTGGRVVERQARIRDLREQAIRPHEWHQFQDVPAELSHLFPGLFGSYSLYCRLSS